MYKLITAVRSLKYKKWSTAALLYGCAGGAGLIALSLFGGSFGSTLPTIGPFLIANQALNIPDMVIFPFHSDIQAAAITNDNTNLLVADRFNNVVQVIDLRTKKKIATVTVGVQPGIEIANDPGPPVTDRVAGIRPTNIIISPAANDNRAFVTAITANEEFEFSASNSGQNIERIVNTLSVIDTNSLQVLETYAVGAEPLGMTITPDGEKVYVANSGQISTKNGFVSSLTVSVINTRTKAVIDIEVGRFPTQLVITPNGQRVYVTHSGTGTDPGQFVSVIDVATDKVLPASFRLDAEPAFMTVSPDGSTVLIANTGTSTNPGRSISVIDVLNDTSFSVPVGTKPVGIAVVQEKDENGLFLASSPKNRIFVANAADDTLSVIRPQNFTTPPTADLIDVVDVGLHPTALAVSNDGRIVFVANSGVDRSPGNTVSIIEAETARVIVGALAVTETSKASPIGIMVENNVDRASSQSRKAFVINNYSISIVEEAGLNSFFVADTIFTSVTGPTKLASIQFDAADPNIKPTLFAASSGKDKVYIMDPLTDGLLRELEVDSTPVDMAVTNDNTKLLVANSGLQNTFGNSVTIVDIEQARINSSPNQFSKTVELECFRGLALDPVECRPVDVVVKEDGQRAYVANIGVSRNSNTISAIDISDANIVNNGEVASERLQLSDIQNFAPLKIAINQDNISLSVLAYGSETQGLLSVDTTQTNDPIFISEREGTFADLKLWDITPNQFYLATAFIGSSIIVERLFGFVKVSNNPGDGEPSPTSLQIAENNERVYVISSGTMANPDTLLSVFTLATPGNLSSIELSATLDVGDRPIDLAVLEVSGTKTDKVYVANYAGNSVSIVEVTDDAGGLQVISDTIESTPEHPIDAPIDIEIIQVADNLTKVYVANAGSNTILVIDPDSDTVIDTIRIEDSIP